MHLSIAVTILISGVVFYAFAKIYEITKNRNISECKKMLPVFTSGLSKKNPTMEKRMQHRIKINMPVTVTGHAAGRYQYPVAAIIGDISISGAFVICDAQLPINALINLEFSEERNLPVIGARIIWSNSGVPYEKTINRGIGIKFIEISDNARKSLEVFLVTASAMQ